MEQREKKKTKEEKKKKEEKEKKEKKKEKKEKEKKKKKKKKKKKGWRNPTSPPPPFELTSSIHPARRISPVNHNPTSGPPVRMTRSKRRHLTGIEQVMQSHSKVGNGKNSTSIVLTMFLPSLTLALAAVAAAWSLPFSERSRPGDCQKFHFAQKGISQAACRSSDNLKSCLACQDLYLELGCLDVDFTSFPTCQREIGTNCTACADHFAEPIGSSIPKKPQQEDGQKVGACKGFPLNGSGRLQVECRRDDERCNRCESSYSALNCDRFRLPLASCTREFGEDLRACDEYASTFSGPFSEIKGRGSERKGFASSFQIDEDATLLHRYCSR
ncbi:hypothetical protein L249_8420 [Ophiocordyceps polyrhachis-furcata BCC 54312]|uniref:Uncharacterized protein n=1 Tax=Ophiocordyceps polyrhachis-furcata BCC 54312 TaxID=1330021 RepID=A0A367L643_9HYPO|nr:hypothetical protein L249_8420 [Ophiocordyceps polyrhachis-furcata BCC 54312]